MMENDEKDLLKRKIEESKEEIIRLNSHIDEFFQVRLASDKNENKFLKLFNANNKMDCIYFWNEVNPPLL